MLASFARFFTSRNFKVEFIVPSIVVICYEGVMVKDQDQADYRTPTSAVSLSFWLRLIREISPSSLG